LSNSIFPFEKLKTVHFGRWLIAPASEKFRASLIYSGNVDGSADDHLKDLASITGEEIDEILGFCEGYPEGPSEKERLAYLKSVSKKTPTFYVGTPGISVQQVGKDRELQLQLQHFIMKNRGKWSTTDEAFTAIRKYYDENRNEDWAGKQPEMPKKAGFKMILLLLLVAVLLPFILLTLLLIRIFYEPWEQPYGKTINEVPLEHLQGLIAQEDIIYQNQISQVFETKTGLRKLFLKFILWATNFAAKHWFIEGSLMGTPTIHFARWVFIDEGKRFVFFSNFDGTFNGYLGDFVDNNGWGLNAIYGAAKGYPKTSFVFGKGSYDFKRFLAWGRWTQVPTQIWYSANPWEGQQQIVRRSKLRATLTSEKELTEAEKVQFFNDI